MKTKPEDVDTVLRDLLTDDERLAFYQWVGAQAVTEAIGIVQENLSNDPREAHAQHYHRDDVEEMLELLRPNENDPYPTKLPEPS